MKTFFFTFAQKKLVGIFIRIKWKEFLNMYCSSKFILKNYFWSCSCSWDVIYWWRKTPKTTHSLAVQVYSSLSTAFIIFTRDRHQRLCCCLLEEKMRSWEDIAYLSAEYMKTTKRASILFYILGHTHWN